MPDAFVVLSADHEEVKQMLADLESGPAQVSGASASQLQERKQLTRALIIAESKHEAVEEEYFWPVVREVVPDGDRLADDGTSQEQDAKVVLDRLEKTDPTDNQFEELVSIIIRDGRAHIAFEEEKVWPRLREVLSAQGIKDLGTELVRGKDLAPTRPHPNIPPRPGILKAAAPAVAAADKVRDIASSHLRH